MSHALPYALYRAAQTRALDRAAIDGLGIPGYTLMSRAGAAAFALLQERWPRVRRVTVLCGAGNNGGDGLVVARLAHQAGLPVTVLLLGDERRIHGDARIALEELEAAGVEPEPFGPDLPRDPGVLVDALLGTGLERPVEGDWRRAIEAINHAHSPCLSIDIPTGLHADTGAVLGVAVQADATISFIGLKQGLFTGAGPGHCGEIRFDDLQVPPRVYASQILSAQRLTWDKLCQSLPPRPGDAHKGDFGHVLVVGGAPGMSGAARMAAEAAARAGAGLVSIATHPSHAPTLNLTRPELMCHAVEDAADLEPLLARATLLALGPGLGRTSWGAGLFEAVVDSPLPKVVDADALHYLSTHPRHREDWILTPHPGEAARLLDQTSAAIQADRFAAAEALSRRYGGVIVLKGAGSLILADRQTPGVFDAGNPGMASGGMGDVLTGLIAGLWAQGLGPLEAARAGACLHGTAGDLAAREGQRGLLAMDLLGPVRGLLG